MDERLQQIIIQSLSGESLSDEEKAVLAEWLEFSSENRAIYQKFRKVYEEGQVFREEGGIDCDKAWASVARRCHIKYPSHSLFTSWRRMGMAAGFILLVGLGTAVWLNSSRKAISESYVQLTDVQEKVHLKLSNGESIELASGPEAVVVSDEGLKVRCDSNLLNYQLDSLAMGDHKPTFNTLVVPVGAEYRLILSDGTLVYMNAASELKYPTVFTGDCREVYLKGEAYFEVVRDTVHPFVVKTEVMDVEVLGTAFNVDAYPGADVSTATLASGKIRAICAGKEYDLVPGYQIRNDRVLNRVSIAEVNLEMYTCWKDGYYYFEACPLEEIMETLSRWYGIHTFFQNPDLKKVEFTGRLKRYEEVDQLFRKFEQTRNICFNRKENTVIVSAK